MSITIERWNSILSDYPGIQSALFDQRRKVCNLLKEEYIATSSDCESMNLRPLGSDVYYSVQDIRVVTNYSKILDKPIGFKLNKLLVVNGAEIEVGNFFKLDGIPYSIYIPVNRSPLGEYINGNIIAFIRSEISGLYISYEVVIYDLSF